MHRQSRSKSGRAPKQPLAVWTAFAGAEALVVGAFLPWITTAHRQVGPSMNGTDTDGKITAALGLAAGIILLRELGDRRAGPIIAVVIFGAIASSLALINWVEARNQVLDAYFSPIDVNIGVGLYVTIAGAVVLAVAGVEVFMAWHQPPEPWAPPASRPVQH